ncbi:threonine/serine ThrE exporter family protein [Nocardioides sp. GXQ0305]|uniref:threonine/serine ThrE exporter family protein n=1 Tax=Nocardioides sp. GXQ0305 TaxID=3423912 RepID=UPI003D7DC50B
MTTSDGGGPPETYGFLRVPSLPVLDLTMRIGDHFLASGMSANDVVVQMLRVIHAYGLSDVHVDLTYTSISVTHYRGPTKAPLTVTRIVQPLLVDYTKVRDLDVLLARIEDGLGVEEAVEAYEAISHADQPYPHWVAALGSGGIAAGATLSFSTSWELVGISFLSGLTMDRLMTWLHKRRLPPFFSQAVVAGLMTMIAGLVAYLGRIGWGPFEDLDPTLIVVGGIVMLLAGVMIVGAVQDAIDQFYVTATARMLEVMMRTAGIVAGILVALSALEAWGGGFRIVNTSDSAAPLWAQYAGAGLIALSFAVYSFSDLGTIALTTSVALVGWSFYVALAEAGFGEVSANTVGALVVGFCATIIVRTTHAPGFGMESGGILPLVPGLALLNGLMQMVQEGGGNPAIVAGGKTLFTGVLVAFGIAAGATLGTYFGRPVNEQVRRFRRQVKAAGRVIVRPPQR